MEASAIGSHTKLDDFKDILQDRRSTSDVMWASRAWNPVSAYIQPHKSSAVRIKSTVLHSYRLRQVIAEISQEEHVPAEELYKKVEDILNEMGYNREVPILRWLGLFTAKILKKLCNAILVNEPKLLKVKSEMGKNPVLFVPSHRSYGDFILMSYICFHYDLDIPRIAAGMDFHSMVLMGRVLRDSCAFFMRRSFNNDKLYSAIFSQYVQTLVTDGDAAVEFFIEGTRSRTAKSLMPKFGFLSMALKPFLTGLVPDISIVPINLSYDRALEEVLFAYELVGVPKPKESTKGFVKALSILNENYGNVYVQFGEPFSVKEYFGNRVDRSLHNFGPIQLQDLTSAESQQIVDLAHSIVNRQRQLTVLTCFNLIAAVINNNIISGKPPLVWNELISEVAWLLPIMESLGAETAVQGDLERNVLLSLDLHKSLVILSSTKEIQLRRVHSRKGTTDKTKLKGHNLLDVTMDVAIPLIMIQNYVNPCAHFIIDLCIIVIVLESYASNGFIELVELFNHFNFLRSIFSFEFVFYGHFTKEDFDKALKHSQKLNIVCVSGPNAVTFGKNKKLQTFCKNFLASYIPAYITLAEFLYDGREELKSDSDVLKGAQDRLEQKLKSGTVLHPANLSLDTFSNALQAFVSFKAVSKSKGTSEVRYKVHPELMQDVLKNMLMFELRISNSELSRQFSTFVNGKL